MNFYEVINKRRTIRQFEQEEIPKEVLERIINAGLKAPSGDGKKDCELIQQRAKLKEEFIRTNSPIKPGTKVKVTRKGTNTVEYGILSKYDCEFHKIIPVISKIKKDGKHEVFFRLAIQFFWSKTKRQNLSAEVQFLSYAKEQVSIAWEWP